jgi:hypothetical protein
MLRLRLITLPTPQHGKKSLQERKNKSAVHGIYALEKQCTKETMPQKIAKP